MLGFADLGTEFDGTDHFGCLKHLFMYVVSFDCTEKTFQLPQFRMPILEIM
jgi:hypothetical protein